MTTRVLIADSQEHATVDARRLRRLVTWLLDRAANLSPGLRFHEVSVALVDDAAIAPVNERFLGHRGPTDVISFSYAGARGVDPAMAELIVNAQRAVEEARRRRADPSRELALYLAHGCQHLAGRDDRTAAGRAAMRRIQNTWLRDAGKAGLTRGLVRPRAA